MKAEKSKVKVLAGSVLGLEPLPSLQMAAISCTPMTSVYVCVYAYVEREEENVCALVSLPLLMRTLWELHLHDLI